MKLKRLYNVLLAAAVAAGMWSCSDETKYDPAPKYDGDEVFFSTETTPTALSIPANATSVSVELNRLRTKGELTVGLTGSVTDPDGADMSSVFNVPTQVTFADGQDVVEIPIGVDFLNVQNDMVYTLSLAVNGEAASPYGMTVASIEMSYRPWTELEPYSTTEYEGVMGSPFTGEAIGGIVYFSKSLVNDNLENWVFPGPRYSNLYFDYDLNVDKSKTLEVQGLGAGKHAYMVSMPDTDIHYDANDGEGAPDYVHYITAREFVIQVLTKFNDMTPEEADQEFIDWAYNRFGLQDSYYVPEDGAFHMFLVPYTESGSLFKISETLLQLPGFSHYEITFAVEGSFIDGDGNESIVINAQRSDDLASYAYAVVPGALTEEQLAAEVTAIENDTEATLYVEQNRNILYTFTENGVYTLVAVGYDAAGQAVYSTSFEFEAESVQKSSEWESKGICEYTDDLVASIYNDFDNFTWEVEYEENINIPGFYRLVSPYKAFVADINEPEFATYKEGKNYLYIHAEDPTCAYVGESLIGVILQGDGPWIVTSQADGLIADGASPEVVKQYGMAGTLEDGVFTMPAESLPVGGQVYANILWVDEAQYGQGWYRGNTHGEMRVDFLTSENAAPRKIKKATAPGSIFMVQGNLVPKLADRSKPEIKKGPAISKYVKKIKF